MASIEEALNPGLVRIGPSPANGSTWTGAGFLATGRRVVTCAHVLNAALGRSVEVHDDAPGRDIELAVSFPYASAVHVLTSRVVAWVPLAQDGTGDIAVLEVTEPLPGSVRPVRLLDSASLYDHPFWCYGFPRGYPGRQATGRLLRAEPNGAVAMEEVKSTGARVEAGFSGTAVWDDELGGVVGMVVTEDLELSAKRAFLLPTPLMADLLAEQWPDFRSLLQPVSQGRQSVNKENVTVFQRVWYSDRPPAPNLYGGRSSTGRLLIAADHLLYEPVDLVIFGRDILKVRFGKAGTDPVNLWISLTHRARSGISTEYIGSGRLLGWAGLMGLNRRMFTAIKELQARTSDGKNFPQ